MHEHVGALGIAVYAAALVELAAGNNSVRGEVHEHTGRGLCPVCLAEADRIELAAETRLAGARGAK